jgi:hypothetical protein
MPPRVRDRPRVAERECALALGRLSGLGAPLPRRSRRAGPGHRRACPPRAVLWLAGLTKRRGISVPTHSGGTGLAGMWECLATFLAPRCRPPPVLQRGVKVTCLAERKDGVVCHLDNDWGFQVSELQTAAACVFARMPTPQRASGVRARSAPARSRSRYILPVSGRLLSRCATTTTAACSAPTATTWSVSAEHALAVLGCAAALPPARGRCGLPMVSPEGWLTAFRCAGAGRGS